MVTYIAILGTICMQRSSGLLYIIYKMFIAQSAGVVEYTNCTSAEGVTLPTTSVLDVTLNNLMVRIQ